MAKQETQQYSEDTISYINQSVGIVTLKNTEGEEKKRKRANFKLMTHKES